MYNIQEQFNKVSAQYDSQRKILIPCFNDFYGIAIENLELENKVPEILDLGAGTGLMSQKVLERYPEANITLVDISNKMLDVARLRFQGMPNVHIIEADLNTYSFGTGYDAVVSSLAIHHLTDEGKISLYKKIQECLKPGGIFINAEQVLADDPFLIKKYNTQWIKKIENSLPKEELAAAYERAKLDIRTPLSTQLNWLKEIGFEHVDCPYKYYDFAVIWAMKADVSAHR